MLTDWLTYWLRSGKNEQMHYLSNIWLLVFSVWSVGGAWWVPGWTQGQWGEQVCQHQRGHLIVSFLQCLFIMIIVLLWFIIHNCRNKEALKGLDFYISISIERRLFQDLTPILGAGKPLWSSIYVLDQDVVLLKLFRWTLFVHLLYSHGFAEGPRILAEQDFVKISCEGLFATTKT